MTPIKHLNRRLARVPTWAAVLLLSTPIGAALSYTFAAHDVAVESSATAQAKASALAEAKAEAAAAKRALARKEAALAAANAKLREVGVRPICDRHDAGMLGMDWSTFKVWNSGEKTVYLNAATSRWVTVDPRTWRT